MSQVKESTWMCSKISYENVIKIVLARAILVLQKLDLVIIYLLFVKSKDDEKLLKFGSSWF